MRKRIGSPCPRCKKIRKLGHELFINAKVVNVCGSCWESAFSGCRTGSTGQTRRRRIV